MPTGLFFKKQIPGSSIFPKQTPQTHSKTESGRTSTVSMQILLSSDGLSIG
jgi:hypothetical protein